MTGLVSQIQVLESFQKPSLSRNDISGLSFERYLEDEKKRIGLLFSPWGNFNFDALFGYPAASSKAEDSNTIFEIFSDSKTAPQESNKNTNPNSTSVQNNFLLNQNLAQISNFVYASITPKTIQQLLLQTGWLTPNLEAHPSFFMAQVDGKLMSKLDLQSLVDKIVSAVNIVKEKGKTELNIALKPENLGEILLTLTSMMGTIFIQIQAPDRSKKIIEDGLEELKDALKKSNINFSEIKIISAEEAKEDA